MFPLPALLIVAAVGAAPTHLDLSGALDVYRCDFEQSADANYDQWPDNWQRRTGRGFPHFVKMAIAEASGGDAPAGTTQPAAGPRGRCLRVELDGGAATAYSPHIPVSPLFSYVFAGYVKTESLKHDEAHFTIDFFDADGNVVDKHTSRRVRQCNQWTQLTINSMLFLHPQAHTARIGLHVHPSGDDADLFGAAQFDDVLLARLPRMTVTANRPHHLFAVTDQVEVICSISGIPQPNPQLRFELYDVAGQLVDQWDHAPSLGAESNAAAAAGSGTATDNPQHVGYVGDVTWRPNLPSTASGAARIPGQYHVRVALESGEALQLERETALAIIEPAKNADRGDFGWSLQSAGDLTELKSLAALLEQVGVKWIKYPVWYAGGDEARAEQITWFAERMRTLNIEFVGLLDDPPVAALGPAIEEGSPPIATVFVEPQLWRPALEPVITRLSQLVRWWQLGDDDDTSYVDLPNVVSNLQQIRDETTRAGQSIDVGLPWSWLHAAPAIGPSRNPRQSERPPLEFLAYTADPQLTADELQEHLANIGERATRTWLTLKPLNKNAYQTNDCIRDLVMRMVAGKTNRADAIFVTDPLSPRYGLLNDDGSPGPLLLPFRTTVQMLGSASYEGELTLPEGSSNHVFSRGDEAILFIWSKAPTSESLYLGPQMRHVDLWGRDLPVEKETVDGRLRHTVQVGPMPTFVTGVNLPIARWCIALQFENERLENLFGRSQTLACNYANSFPRGIGGRIKIHPPSEWRVDQSSAEFQIPPQETQSTNFEVLLRADASTGPQKLRLDFDISADREYQFSAFRTIHVGGGDIDIELRTRVDAQGRLIVEQRMTNNKEKPVSFNCLLLAPQRRRLRERVVNLGRGQATTLFVYPNGEELIGKTLWLRAEEIRGERILNYHIVAEP